MPPSASQANRFEFSCSRRTQSKFKLTITCKELQLTRATSFCIVSVCLYSFLLDRKSSLEMSRFSGGALGIASLLFDNRKKQARTRLVHLRTERFKSSLPISSASRFTDANATRAAHFAAESV